VESTAGRRVTLGASLWLDACTFVLDNATMALIKNEIRAFMGDPRTGYYNKVFNLYAEDLYFD
jgi:hypothetical protein